MADFVFDDLGTGAGVYFDDLDVGAGTYYNQDGNAVLSFPNSALQGTSDVYEQGLDVTLEIFAGATQEWFAPGGPQTYFQPGGVFVLFYGSTVHEHVPASPQAFLQQAAPVLTFAQAAAQQHFPGATTGYIQQAGAGLFLQPDAAQSYTTAGLSGLYEVTVDDVQPFRSTQATRVTLHPTDFLTVSQVDIEVGSTSVYFANNAGRRGGAVLIEVAMLRGGARTPLVSLSQARPSATFFRGQVDESGLNALASAILDEDAVTFELGAYEIYAGRVIPMLLGGSASVNLRVYP